MTSWFSRFSHEYRLCSTQTSAPQLFLATDPGEIFICKVGICHLVPGSVLIDFIIYCFEKINENLRLFVEKDWKNEFEITARNSQMINNSLEPLFTPSGLIPCAE